MNTIEKIISIIVRVTEQGIDQVNAKLNTLGKNAQTAKQNVDGFSKSTKDATKNNKEYSDSTKNAGDGTKNVGNEARKSGFYMRNFGRNIARATSIVATFSIAVGILQGTLRVIQFFTIDAARAAANFQEALLDLQAVAAVSNADMEKLSENILSVAGSTRFMAEEIAGLQKTLGRLGFDTGQIIASTEAIARFAEATGEDLNRAAEVTAKTLNAFSLEASSAFEVTNQLTTIINNTALSFDDLGTALQYPSSVANTLGVQLEETTALLGVLSNAGIRASRAGTGLRAILTELGAEGGSLIPVLEELAEGGLSLSEAEELVGRRFAGTLTVLVRQLDVVKELTAAQNDLTSAFIASARQNSGFNAQVRILQAGIQSLLIDLGEWITQTNILLNIIEKITGDDTARGFSILSQIGFEEGELAKAAEDIEAFRDVFDIDATVTNRGTQLRSFTIDVDALAKSLGVTRERAQELAGEIENVVTERNFFGFIKDSETLKNLFSLQNGLVSLSEDIDVFTKAEQEAIKTTSELTLEVFDFEQSVKDGLATDGDRNDLFDRVDEKIRQTRSLLETLDPSSFEFTVQEQVLEELNRLLSIITNVDLTEGDRSVLDPLILEEREVVSVEETINRIRELGNAIDEALRRGDLNLANNLRLELGEILLQLRTFSQEDLKQFPSVWEAILLDGVNEDVRNLIDEQSKEVAALTERTLNEYLSQQEVLDAGFEDLGWLGRILYGAGAKNPEETQEEFLQRIKDIEQLAQQGAIDIARTANQVAFDATQRRLRGEEALLDARYDYERDRLESLVEANLITQEEYERQREKLAEERVKKENELDKKRFEAEKARALTDIAINTAIAITGLNPADPAYFVKLAIVSATSAAQAAIVASQQFVPVKYEEGGWVNGKRHSEGGVPFTVQGRGGYEMEGGEFIVNRISAMKNASLLERINNEGKVKSLTSQRHYQDGGAIPNLNDPLETIAKATTETANALRKPMRAYVSERELVRKTNARITTEKNADL